MPRVNPNQLFDEFDDEPFVRSSSLKRKEDSVKKVRIKVCGNCGTRLNSKGICPNCRPKHHDDF